MHQAFPLYAAGLLLLSGCGFAESNAPVAPRPPSSVKAPSNQSAPARSVRPPAQKAVTAAPAEPILPESPAAGASLQLTDLIGMDERTIEALLGPSMDRREETPAKSFRYSNGTCSFTLRLYLDLNEQVFKALSYEVHSHDPADEGSRSCLAHVGTARVADR